MTGRRPSDWRALGGTMPRAKYVVRVYQRKRSFFVSPNNCLVPEIHRAIKLPEKKAIDLAKVWERIRECDRAEVELAEPSKSYVMDLIGNWFKRSEVDGTQ